MTATRPRVHVSLEGSDHRYTFAKGLSQAPSAPNSLVYSYFKCLLRVLPDAGPACHGQQSATAERISGIYPHALMQQFHKPAGEKRMVVRVTARQILGLVGGQAHVNVYIKDMPLTIAKSLASCLLLLSGLACADVITGKVIGVMDGDTIEVLDANKTPRRIRLAGIDAPEKAQPFGARSKQHLSDQVFGKQVEVLSNKTDKYGRTVGKVMIGGKDANLEQVRSGFAWHYKEYQKEQSAGDRVAYASAEISARSIKSGLWRDPKPMPPWEWRRGGKDEPSAQSLASGCPCGGVTFCAGSRGGQYCIAPNGKRKY